MTLAEIRRLLECDVICGEHLLDTDVQSCFAADMMSDVLAFSSAGALLVTGLASLQSVHTADLADLKAILYIHDKRPDGTVVDVARQKGIPLLTTPRYMVEACAALFESGLKVAAKA